jgi:seryl-tRNA(Sec) selenium transferase
MEHSNNGLYERDFYAWTQEQAIKLRTGILTDLDLENIAEELEGMGRAEKRQLGNRLSLIIMHLLKMSIQSDKLPHYGNSWRATIREQRRRVQGLLKDNPSLKAALDEVFAEAYQDAVDEAIRETNLPESAFPEINPFSLGQVLDRDYWPTVF